MDMRDYILRKNPAIKYRHPLDNRTQNHLFEDYGPDIFGQGRQGKGKAKGRNR